MIKIKKTEKEDDVLTTTSFCLSEETLEQVRKTSHRLGAIASSAYMPPRTLIRTWIMQRLGAEQMNENPAFGAEVGATTPIADGHRTQGAGAGVNID